MDSIDHSPRMGAFPLTVNILVLEHDHAALDGEDVVYGIEAIIAMCSVNSFLNLGEFGAANLQAKGGRDLGWKPDDGILRVNGCGC